MMRKIEISGRVAACASALVLAGSALAACGGSSGTTNRSSMARTGTAAASSAGSSAAQATKAPSAKARAQLAQRIRSLRSKTARARPAVAPAVQQAAFRTALTHFAGCLRQQGVKIPAPDTSGGGPVLSMRGVNTSSPQYRAALTKCRGVLVAAFRQARARR